MTHNSATSSLPVNTALALCLKTTLRKAQENILDYLRRHQSTISCLNSPLIANPDIKGGLSRG
jgi:hypothetical protein